MSRRPTSPRAKHVLGSGKGEKLKSVALCFPHVNADSTTHTKRCCACLPSSSWAAKNSHCDASLLAIISSHPCFSKEITFHSGDGEHPVESHDNYTLSDPTSIAVPHASAAGTNFRLAGIGGIIGLQSQINGFQGTMPTVFLHLSMDYFISL